MSETPQENEQSAIKSPTSQRTHTRGSMMRDIALFTVARLLLALALAAAIIGVAALFGVQIYPLVALLFAVLIAMPLSFVLFRPLRSRINEAIAAVDEQRRQQRAELEAKLRSGPAGGTQSR